MKGRRFLAVPLIAAAAVVCSPAAGAATSPPVFVISGGGFGHGVGMSQYGAEGYALRGYRYQHILAHYYPGTRLSRAHETAVRVLLASERRRVRIGSAGSFRVTDARGRSFRLPAGTQAGTRWFSIRVHRRRRLLRLPLRFQWGAAPLTVDGAAYRGWVTVWSEPGGFFVVNTVQPARADGRRDPEPAGTGRRARAGRQDRAVGLGAQRPRADVAG